MEKKLKLKKGDSVWVALPIKASVESVNQKFGYTLRLEGSHKGVIAQYFGDDEIEKIYPT